MLLFYHSSNFLNSPRAKLISVDGRRRQQRAAQASNGGRRKSVSAKMLYFRAMLWYSKGYGEEALCGLHGGQEMLLKRRYDKKRRLKCRRHFLSRVCTGVCGSYVYVSF